MIGAYWSMRRHGFFVPILIPVVITVSRLNHEKVISKPKNEWCLNLK